MTHLWQQKKFSYLSIEKVHQLLKRKINVAVEPELIPVKEAYGRIIAENVTSDVNIPAFDVSHFDGYAVRAEDTSIASLRKPVLLKVVCQKDSTNCGIDVGETAPILTGHRMPLGANAVVPVENTMLKEDAIKIHQSVQPFQRVVRAGRDVEAGEEIVTAGHFLRHQDVKLLMDIKKWKIWVFKKPRIAVVSIGDELTNRIEESDLKKFSSLEVMISTLIEEVGGNPLNMQITPDKLSAITQTIEKALEKTDIVVTIGGSSVGDKDHTWEAINSLNPTLRIRGIKVHPGRVTSLALINNKPIVMLAGHVQSTIVGFFAVLLPIIQMMTKRTPTIEPTVEARMAQELLVEEFIPFKTVRFVKLKEEKGHYIAEPVLGDSSLTNVLVKADGFVIVEEKKTIVKKGAKVRVHFLPGEFSN
jgi:molybdopterin molybdotransferase